MQPSENRIRGTSLSGLCVLFSLLAEKRPADPSPRSRAAITNILYYWRGFPVHVPHSMKLILPRTRPENWYNNNLIKIETFTVGTELSETVSFWQSTTEVRKCLTMLRKWLKVSELNSVWTYSLVILVWFQVRSITFISTINLHVYEGFPGRLWITFNIFLKGTFVLYYFELVIRKFDKLKFVFVFPWLFMFTLKRFLLQTTRILSLLRVSQCPTASSGDRI